MESKPVTAHLFWNVAITDKIQLDAIDKINDGKLIELLEGETFQQLFSLEAREEENVPKNWKLKIGEHAEACLSIEKQLEFLAMGTASLLLFIQQNWTGPKVNIKNLCLLNYNNEKLLVRQKISVFEELVVDGENVVSSAQHPELLLLSKLILKESHTRFGTRIGKFWYLRSLFIHQEVLEENSIRLFDEMQTLMDEISNFMDEMEDVNLTEQYLELARISLYYNCVQRSLVDIRKSIEHCGIRTTLTGALGKRTKFQKEDLPQMTLKVDIIGNSKVADDDDFIESALPPDLSLCDDVRLNKIKFKDDEDGEYPNLSGLHQANILGLFNQTEKSQPKDKLADEELQPLISCILDKPKSWAIKFSTLLLRSKLELNQKRSVERSLVQIEALTNSINNESPPSPARLKYFFVSYLPPRWQIESCLAKVMVSVGAYKSALDIYLRLQDWENVIICYNLLEMSHKAKEIIEQELNKNPTVKLLCYLGDVTEDVSHYESAWKLSKGRSARAQRHWAMFYYNRGEYGKAIRHFEISLEKNSLQSNLWYHLGYSAMHEEKWNISVSAYHRFCVLNPECLEAWNNLAKCYSELKQTRRAWRALLEAVKLDYSNWRVWNNYMIVSTELKEFHEAIRCYHKILDFTGKHLDIQILNALVVGFKEAEKKLGTQKNAKEKEAYKEDFQKYREKLTTLFGRITSQIVAEPRVWYLYSKIIPRNDAADHMKRYKILLKSYNAAINKNTWIRTMESCRDVVDLISELVNCSILVEDKNILRACQFSVLGCLALLKREYPGDEICDELEEKYLELKQKIESMN